MSCTKSRDSNNHAHTAIVKDAHISNIQTPEEPRQVLRLIPSWPSNHVYQQRQNHCPAWTEPFARCVEACHHAQAQQIISIKVDLEVLPQIFVHQTRAQTKTNLILKTIRKNLGTLQNDRRCKPAMHTAQEAPESTWRTGKFCQHASQNKEDHRKQYSSCKEHVLEKHKQELRCGKPQNEVLIIPRVR